MDVVRQLQLDFNAAVQDASADPGTANLSELWLLVEPILNQLHEGDRLRIAGEVIAQLADIYNLRAERILADWEESHNDTGPVISDDLLAGLIQRTMYLDISELIRKPKGGKKRKPSKAQTSEDSIVGVVEKEKLLAFVDAQEEETAKEEALAVAHEEDVSAWKEAIAQWMQTHKVEEIPLLQLYKTVEMPLVQVWLALLLGNFAVEQRKTFYDADGIWVSRDGIR